MESEYKGDGKIQFRKLKLQEFCDMEKLYKLLDNWSKSSGMACVLVDQDGNRFMQNHSILRKMSGKMSAVMEDEGSTQAGSL